MRKGFTLVELSIVLVIIGLLIGGILVGQSMISTSKVVAFVSQIQHIDAEVEAFKAKYNYLPGDAPQFSGGGNGILSEGPNCPFGATTTQVYDCDYANFWGDLEPQTYITTLNAGSVGCSSPTYA